jgi:purine-binding chemotaxis protein CheW
MGSVVQIRKARDAVIKEQPVEQFLAIRVAGQLFGIPVLKVRDVLKPQKITRVPLSETKVRGLINLRGRIVTVIDMDVVLSSTPAEANTGQMFIVVDCDGEFYSLMVDKVEQTIILKVSEFEKNPVNLSQNWREYSRGVFKLEEELMLVLDIAKVIKG